MQQIIDFTSEHISYSVDCRSFMSGDWSVFVL
jgi:hypothetical protein